MARFGLSAGIEIDRHDAELLAGDEVELRQRGGEGVQLLTAQHRAVAVVEREDDRQLVTEHVAQRDVATTLIAKPRIQRNLRAEVLDQPDALGRC